MKNRLTERSHIPKSIQVQTNANEKLLQLTVMDCMWIFNTIKDGNRKTEPKHLDIIYGKKHLILTYSFPKDDHTISITISPSYAIEMVENLSPVEKKDLPINNQEAVSALFIEKGIY